MEYLLLRQHVSALALGHHLFVFNTMGMLQLKIVTVAVAHPITSPNFNLYFNIP